MSGRLIGQASSAGLKGLATVFQMLPKMHCIALHLNNTQVCWQHSLCSCSSPWHTANGWQGG
jgi:hypothetical protein